MTLEPLSPDFRAKVEELLAGLNAAGVIMRVYSTVRTPWEQARLWRQGRTSEQIAITVQRLRQQGAPRIATCIESVGPQHGRKVTNAAPGYSWHNFGEAVDCFRVDRDGNVDWDEGAYKPYAAAARKMGLRAGADFNDHPHVQFKHHEPHADRSPAQLEIALCELYPTFAVLKGG